MKMEHALDIYFSEGYMIRVVAKGKRGAHISHLQVFIKRAQFSTKFQVQNTENILDVQGTIADEG